MMPDAPQLLLRRRTPAERTAWLSGARCALSLVQGRLPVVLTAQPIGTIDAAVLARVLADIGLMLTMSEECDANPTE